MKKRFAQVLTVALIGGLFGFFAYRQRRAAPVTTEADGPESAIWRMVDASRAGDPERYLGCYSGEMERQLRQNLKDMGEARFREYLESRQREIKGIAVSPPRISSNGDALVKVEYVFADRNETQQVLVRRVGQQWRILRVDGAERIKTLVPYGTPVTE